MDVCVIGTGYVGLVTGACLAHIGHHVVCVDNNAAKVRRMQSGQTPIYEPGLQEIMQTAMAADRLQFTTDLKAGVRHGAILFIAVGTPPLPTGESDTRYVEAVARGIGTHLDGRFKVIVNKSTVPIGSGNWVRQLVLSELDNRSDATAEMAASFAVVSNPEFLREGSAVRDTFNPDRIVLGGENPRALAMMQELYAPIVARRFSDDRTLPPVSVLIADLASAETIKYAANAFLATKISFINEVANICDRVGANVTEVARGIGLDARIGPKFLQAGIGGGGSCFPKDVAALVHTARDYGYEPQILAAAVATNQKQRSLALEKLQQALKVLKGKTIGLLGLAFKPNTDDLRDAPALTLAEQLQRLGAKVRAYDPIVQSADAHPGLAAIALATSPEELAKGADALVLATDWPQFQELDYSKLARSMATPVLVDGRNYLDPAAMVAAGFYYISIGRGTAGLFPAERLSTGQPADISLAARA